MKKEIKILMIILIITILLRSIHLYDKAYGTDESASINNARVIIEKGPTYMSEFGNPPLFFFLLGILLALTKSILVLKTFMVIIGLLNIILFYILVSKLTNKKTALVSAFLLSINPMHVLFSQHIRVYILLMLVYILSLIIFIKLRETKEKKYLIYLFIIYVISIYLHYLSGTFVLTQLIWFLIENRKNKEIIKSFFIFGTIALILLLPLIPYFISQYNYLLPQGNLVTGSKVTLQTALYPIYKFSTMLDISSTPKIAPYLIITAPIVFLVFLIGIMRFWKEDRRKTIFILTNFILPILLLIILTLFFPIYSFKYVSFLLPLYVLFIGKNHETIIGKILLLIIIILWLTVLFHYYSIVTQHHWTINFAV